MLTTDRVIVVEGKYDAIKLANIIDAVIIRTDGFGIFRNPGKQELLKLLGREKGLAVLTDSDHAGFMIRNFLKSIIPEEQLTHIYIPDIYGKEKRKRDRSSEGKMGVEGVPDEVLKDLLLKSGITGETQKNNSRKIEGIDFYEDGFSGKDGSAGRRLSLQEHLGLPENLTSKQLRDVLNKLISYDEYRALARVYGERGETIELPHFVEELIERLETAGFEAYVVGGSVRDSLLGRKPFDWDVTTNALPGEVKEVFRDYETVDTGIKHGTVTVITGGTPVEITTYRVDGEYRDGRHPENVSFTGSLREDLARRDFTVNSIAYNPGTGLYDPFHGRADIEKRIIRTVGNPEKRFSEDALRILRCLRFSAVLGFGIHPDTASAVRKLKESLGLVSGERKASEIRKLLTGEYAENVMLEYREVFLFLFPGTDEKNFEKNVKAVSSAPYDFETRLALLLRGNGSMEEIFRMYRFSNREREETLKIENNLSADLTEGGNRYIMCKMLNKYGSDTVYRILFAKEALAVNGEGERYPVAEAFRELEEIEEQGICYRIKDLHISGEDLKNTGIEEGPVIGETLEFLLDKVMNGETGNSREELLEKLKEKGN